MGLAQARPNKTIISYRTIRYSHQGTVNTALILKLDPSVQPQGDTWNLCSPLDNPEYTTGLSPVCMQGKQWESACSKLNGYTCSLSTVLLTIFYPKCIHLLLKKTQYYLQGSHRAYKPQNVIVSGVSTKLVIMLTGGFKAGSKNGVSLTYSIECDFH